jgi:hypothetical protein
MDFLFAQEIPEVKDIKLNKEGKIIMPIGKIVKSIAGAVKSNIRQRGMAKHKKTLRKGFASAEKQANELSAAERALDDLDESARAITGYKGPTRQERRKAAFQRDHPELWEKIVAASREASAEYAALSPAEKEAFQRPQYFKYGVYGPESAVKATARRKAKAQATTKGKGYKAK